jgi:hypothetical protein
VALEKVDIAEREDAFIATWIRCCRRKAAHHSHLHLSHLTFRCNAAKLLGEQANKIFQRASSWITRIILPAYITDTSHILSVLSLAQMREQWPLPQR